ncbi:hypothetical protein SCUCBS95973_008658 [Sporothrix curviconia]|uniref:Uncharacterized protein n=1 Tax=Sporothrix curviconia TaxID=1260050 RepID=A0ABP0CPW9_9PEZI
MSCDVFAAPSPLPSAPIVVTCTAPVAAPVPIPIPSQVPMSVSTPPRLSPSRNTTDRLREGLHRPLPFARPSVRRHRPSVFLEMGVIREEGGASGDGVIINDDTDVDDELCETEDIDEILPGSRQARQAQPVSGILLTNFLRLGFEDTDNNAAAAPPPTGSPLSSSRLVDKRMPCSPAGTPSSSTDMSLADGTALSHVSTNTLSTRSSRTWSMATSVTTQSSALFDHKRPWFSKLRGNGSK